MQIDHDPKEPSHRAWIIMGVVTFILVALIMVSLEYGLRNLLSQVPTFVHALIVGLAIGFGVGMRVGWWDCERYHSRTPGNDG